MATLTLTIPDEQIPRLQAGFAERVGKDEVDVTSEDIRQELMRLLKLIVRAHEENVAATAAEAGVVDVDVT